MLATIVTAMLAAPPADAIRADYVESPSSRRATGRRRRDGAPRRRPIMRDMTPQTRFSDYPCLSEENNQLRT